MLIGSISHYFFGITIFITSLFLILLVLVQRGRGGGIAGALGGAGGQSAFGTKAGDLFTRITVGVASFWILLCCAAIFFLKPTGFSTGFTGDKKDKTSATTTDTGAGAGTATGAGASGAGSAAPTGGAPSLNLPPVTTPANTNPPATTTSPAAGTESAPAVPGATAPTSNSASTCHRNSGR